MANKRAFIIFAMLAALALILGGCYTQLRGPVRTESTVTPRYEVYEEEDTTVIEEPQPLVERHYYFDVGLRPWWYDPYWYWYPFRPYRSGFYFSIGVWDWDPWWDWYWWDFYSPYWYYGRWYWAWSPYPYPYGGGYYYSYRFWPYRDWTYWVVEPMRRRPFDRRRGLASREQSDSEDWVMSKRPASSSEERRIKKASEEVIKGRTATREAPIPRRIKKRTRTDDRIKVTSQAEVRRIKKQRTESDVDYKTRSEPRRIKTLPTRIRKPKKPTTKDDKTRSETRRTRTVSTKKKEEPKKPITKTKIRKRKKSPEMKTITPRRIRYTTPVARTPSRPTTIRRPATTSRAPAPTVTTKSTSSSSKSSSKSSRRQRR